MSKFVLQSSPVNLQRLTYNVLSWSSKGFASLPQLTANYELQISYSSKHFRSHHERITDMTMHKLI